MDVVTCWMWRFDNSSIRAQHVLVGTAELGMWEFIS